MENSQIYTDRNIDKRRSPGNHVLYAIACAYVHYLWTYYALNTITSISLIIFLCKFITTLIFFYKRFVYLFHLGRVAIYQTIECDWMWIKDINQRLWIDVIVLVFTCSTLFSFRIKRISTYIISINYSSIFHLIFANCR